MILPKIQGSLDQKGFFIYAAADSIYFEQYGIPLINSTLRNTKFGIHLHIYNPTDKQIKFLEKTDRVSYTYEIFDKNLFKEAIDFWNKPDLIEPFLSRRKRTIGLKQYSDSADITAWIFKTYYACMRFVRLAEIIREPRRFLEIDVDGVVRKNFQVDFPDDEKRDFYLYEKEKKDPKTGQMNKNGHLAGAILYTDKVGSLNFIRDLAERIKIQIENNNIYWFLDQECLDSAIPSYKKGILPITYIDWQMRPESAIWNAKGKRKHLPIFMSEIKKYA